MSAARTVLGILLLGLVLGSPAARAQTAGASNRQPPKQTRAGDPDRTRTVRVLLVVGGPVRDFQFVRTLFARESQELLRPGSPEKPVELSVFMQPGLVHPEPSGPGWRALRHFPNRLGPDDPHDKGASLSDYDVLIAFDPDWTALDRDPRQNARLLGLLQEWVRRHAGTLVVVAGGWHSHNLSRPGENQVAAVADLLPVALEGLNPNPPEVQDPERPVVPAISRGFTLHFTPRARAYDFLNLTEDRANPLGGWGDFFRGGRGFHECYPVAKVRPGAEVLATFAGSHVRGGKDETPYLAILRSGTGKTVYLGSGETWRLRKYQEAFFERFWNRLAGVAVTGKPTRPTEVVAAANGVRVQVTPKRLQARKGLTATVTIRIDVPTTPPTPAGQLTAPGDTDPVFEVRATSGTLSHGTAPPDVAFTRDTPVTFAVTRNRDGGKRAEATVVLTYTTADQPPAGEVVIDVKGHQGIGLLDVTEADNPLFTGQGRLQLTPGPVVEEANPVGGLVAGGIAVGVVLGGAGLLARAGARTRRRRADPPPADEPAEVTPVDEPPPEAPPIEAAPPPLSPPPEDTPAETTPPADPPPAPVVNPWTGTPLVTWEPGRYPPGEDGNPGSVGQVWWGGNWIDAQDARERIDESLAADNHREQVSDQIWQDGQRSSRQWMRDRVEQLVDEVKQERADNAARDAAWRALNNIENIAEGRGDTDLWERAHERAFRPDGSIDMDYVNQLRTALRNRIGRDRVLPDEPPPNWIAEGLQQTAEDVEGILHGVENVLRSHPVRFVAGLLTEGASEGVYLPLDALDAMQESAAEAARQGRDFDLTDRLRAGWGQLAREILPLNTAERVAALRDGDPEATWGQVAWGVGLDALAVLGLSHTVSNGFGGRPPSPVPHEVVEPGGSRPFISLPREGDYRISPPERPFELPWAEGRRGRIPNTDNTPANEVSIPRIGEEPDGNGNSPVPAAPASQAAAGLSANEVGQFARQYADGVNGNRGFRWRDFGRPLTEQQQSAIRQYAREAGLLDGYDKVRFYGPGNQYVDFSQVAHDLTPPGGGAPVKTVSLPEHLWGQDRQAHFDYLNRAYFGGVNNQPVGWTWHHMAEPGQMQLVPRGLHGAIDHVGGMSPGHWGEL